MRKYSVVYLDIRLRNNFEEASMEFIRTNSRKPDRYFIPADAKMDGI